jgi:DNA-binding MarR family transcriptional regulator
MNAPVGTAHRKASDDAAGPMPAGCTNFKLRQLTRRVTQHFDRIVASAGLKTTQYSLLSHIERLGPVPPGELARAMTMDASTLTRNLKPLIKLGWAELGPGVNGRSRVVAATAAGRAKRAEAARQWKRAQLDLNARLGNAKVAHLHDVLEECLALLEPEAGSVDG